MTFTARENAELVSFGFHPALKITKITDETGKLLTGERSPDGSVRITPATPFVQGQAGTGPSSTRARSPATTTARLKD